MRLTNAMRDNILDSETKAKFNEKFEKIEQEMQSEITSSVKKAIEGIKFPSQLFEENYLLRSNRVTVVFQDSFRKEHMKNENYYQERSYQIDETLPVKPHDGQHVVKVTKKMESIYIKKRELKEEKRKFESELRTIIYSFNTSDQLLENIPEFKDYFKDELSKKNTMTLVPLEQIKNIRKQLAKN